MQRLVRSPMEYGTSVILLGSKANKCFMIIIRLKMIDSVTSSKVQGSIKFSMIFNKKRYLLWINLTPKNLQDILFEVPCINNFTMSSCNYYKLHIRDFLLVKTFCIESLIGWDLTRFSWLKLNLLKLQIISVIILHILDIIEQIKTNKIFLFAKLHKKRYLKVIKKYLVKPWQKE